MEASARRLHQIILLTPLKKLRYVNEYCVFVFGLFCPLVYILYAIIFLLFDLSRYDCIDRKTLEEGGLKLRGNVSLHLVIRVFCP